MKRAPGRFIRRIRNTSRNAVQSFPPFRTGGQGFQKTFCIRVMGAVKDLLGVSLFHDYSGVHDINPFGDIGHDAEVVGNI